MHLGDGSVEKGGYGTSGSVTFTAPANEPCALTMYNSALKDLTVFVSGSGIGTYLLSLDYPYDSSKSHSSGGQSYGISSSTNVVHMYIGAQQSISQTATVSWSEVVTETQSIYLIGLSAIVAGLFSVIFF